MDGKIMGRSKGWRVTGGGWARGAGRGVVKVNVRSDG